MSKTEILYLHIYALNNAEQIPLHLRFCGLTEHQYALLLDSAGESSNENKYSFMLWDPEIVVTHKNERTIILNVSTNKKTVSRSDPLQIAQKLLDDLKARLVNASVNSSINTVHHNQFDSLPFQSGIAGLIGYDMADYYLGTSQRNKSERATADLIVGLYKKVIIQCNASKKQYFCYVSSSPHPLDTPSSVLPIQSQQGEFELTSSWQSNISKSDYDQAIEKIHQYLFEGDCYQTNYSQCFSAQYTGSLYTAYLRLREKNKAPFSAFMVTPQGAVVSVSPERFLRVKERLVETRPIKGTRPRYKNKAEDLAAAKQLLASDKDRAENLMIVDLLRNDLSKHCEPNSVNVPELFKLESYEAVHHMVSAIEGTLKPSSSAIELLKDAFPGGSITGAPKIRAMEIIDELEPHQRNIYCGTIFYNGWRNDMDSSICIRTVLAESNTLYCCAGGGIVIDSVAKDEYQETFDKVANILTPLQKNE